MESHQAILLKNNPGSLRLFFAFNSNWEWNNCIEKIQNGIDPNVAKLNRRSNLHLTLLFLGSLDNAYLIELISKVRFHLSIEIDRPVFTNPRLRKVNTRNGGMIWIEFDRNEYFSKLSRIIYDFSKEFCPQINFRENPIPHITIARFKKNQEVNVPENIVLPEYFTPQGFELWASCSGVGGLIYLPLFRFNSLKLDNK